ncbi:hypothetical protein PAXINDRAFT_20433 [Paxillus involutus ATCC 200175]|uniref:Uncharacterized protein n=1 Tax=Paxillus involutus ATCC 200175 TaxID=664439 RepID=A0A0C9T4Q5_PAXIN|nr:hypothetical protein PAXINDRAFT_20433 [Paxillus involutus ATCC 200175]
MPVCQGCQKTYAPAGYSQHLARTANPACAAIYTALRNYLPQVNKMNSANDNDEPIPFEGDFFGSGDDDPEVFPWSNVPCQAHQGGLEDEVVSGPSAPVTCAVDNADGELDEELDAEDEGELADLEGGWEPPVPDTPGLGDLHSEDAEVQANGSHDLEEDDHNPTVASTARQAAETPLQKGRHITHFPIPTAGQPIPTQNVAHTQFESYESNFAKDPANAYAPFTSSMEWKFVRWAKLRGPGSTSVSELLEIDGVSFLHVTYS